MKKIFAAVVSAVMLICMAGCSGNYVMTEEDIAVQKSIEGCWAADESTGYNEYDGNGTPLSITAVQFTSDYKYLLYICMLGEGGTAGYVMTYDPIAYSFEDKLFRVDVDGVPTYARISVSEDGQTLYWITDEQTDRYNRLTDEQATEIGIPPYDPAYWEEKKNSKEESVTESETGDVTESETGSVSENTEEGAPVVNSNVDVSADIDVNKLNFDKSVTFDNGNADVDNAPVFLWESEDAGIAVYGIYLYDGKEPRIFIEHDGVIDTFEQDWLTPRSIEPRFKYGDFDNNGTDELAAIYYVGSGTGISVEELVFYKLSDGHFQSYAFDPVSYLENVITADIDNEAHTVTFTYITNGGGSVSYDTAEDYPNGIDEIGWGSNIGYEFDGNDVILTAHPSVNLSYECMPKVTAKVSYWDACGVEFGFGDITIDKEF